MVPSLIGFDSIFYSFLESFIEILIISVKLHHMTNNLVFAKKIMVKLWERLSSRDNSMLIAAGKPLPQAEKNFCKSLEVSVTERY